MKRVIFYEYFTRDVGCGCCNEGISEYTVVNDNVSELPVCCPLFETEEELRKYLSFLEPFEVDSESQYF